MGTQEHVRDLQRIVLTAAEMAEKLRISQRHLWALNSSGRLPRPIRLGRAVRWSMSEIEDWLTAGAPTREQWEKMRD
jgi:excisionase family DNA binding protein